MSYTAADACHQCGVAYGIRDGAHAVNARSRHISDDTGQKALAHEIPIAVETHERHQKARQLGFARRFDFF